MIEVIAGIIVLVVLLGILYAVPRYVSDGGSVGGNDPASGWPDFLQWLEGFAAGWLARSRITDLIVGVLTIVVLAGAISMYQDPAILGGLSDSAIYVTFGLGILGLVGIFSTAYISVRRSGLHGAEATLIGSTLSGVVLLLLITALLIS